MILLVIIAVGALLAYRYAKSRYPVEYRESVERWAAEYDVDPYLIFTVIRTESSFNPNAESHAGAIGLMQMTEDTFDWIKSHIAEDEPLVYRDLLQPDVSIRFGTYFFSICLQRYGGDVSTAAAAYHSGWGTVDTLLAEEDSDTQILTIFPYDQMAHYVNKINEAYERYTTLYA